MPLHVVKHITPLIVDEKEITGRPLSKEVNCITTTLHPRKVVHSYLRKKYYPTAKSLHCSYIQFYLNVTV